MDIESLLGGKEPFFDKRNENDAQLLEMLSKKEQKACEAIWRGVEKTLDEKRPAVDKKLRELLGAMCTNIFLALKEKNLL